MGRYPTRWLFGLSVLLSCGLLVRALVTGTHSHTFFAWNLFLAWIPYALAIGVERLATHIRPGMGLLLLPIVPWLLFFPNAPYLVTDFVHLPIGSFLEVILDSLLITAFAALGMALGLLSLHRVHAIVTDRHGARGGWVFATVVLLLTGAGIWIGRVLRWNSWDLVTNPVGLMETTLEALVRPWEHLPAIRFTLVFAACLAVLYLRLPAPSRRRVN